VSVSPEELFVNAQDPAVVTVRVTSRDQPGLVPPSGSTLVMSTSIGDFSEAGSGLQSLAALLDQGRASAFLFAGAFAGRGTVSAQLEGSVGRQSFTVVVDDPPTPFILGVSPNTGPAGGGTRVTITGTGFDPPLRVLFQDKLAAVRSATTDTIVVTTPPADIVAQDCDDDGDGINGTKEEDLPVQISVENAIGTTETLPNAFTYTVPNAGVCVGD
jgi:hypothetical protein